MHENIKLLNEYGLEKNEHLSFVADNSDSWTRENLAYFLHDQARAKLKKYLKLSISPDLILFRHCQLQRNQKKEWWKIIPNDNTIYSLYYFDENKKLRIMELADGTFENKNVSKQEYVFHKWTHETTRQYIWPLTPTPKAY
jgi:hypothetical protein